MRDPAVGSGGDGKTTKQPTNQANLSLLNQPIQLVSSYGDEPRRPINSLILSLGNNLPAKRNSVVWCESVWIGRGGGAASVSVCVSEKCVFVQSCSTGRVCGSYKIGLLCIQVLCTRCRVTPAATSVLIHCGHWRLRLSHFYPVSGRLIDDLMNSSLWSPTNTRPGTQTGVRLHKQDRAGTIRPSLVRQELIAEQLMER